MAVPAWLDGAFLGETLREDLKTESDIISYSVKPAVAPGNNYLSDIFRVAVKYGTKKSTLHHTISLIVKAPMVFEGDQINGDLEEFDFLGNEPRAYQKLLPRLNDKVKCEFGPKFYPCTVKNAVVLQDLKEEGYLMKSRFDQLDFKHCREVVKTLAKFHAASLACFKDNPSLKNLNQHPPMDEEEPFVRTMKLGMLYCARRVAEITKEMEECKGFSEHVLTRIDHLWECRKEAFAAKEENFNVMLHGDLWTTNVMFQYDDKGEIKGVKFLDFQLTRYGSPVVDLVLFLWTSGNSEVRESHLPEVQGEYLDILNSTLQELGCQERYSLKQLQHDLREAADQVLSLLVSHLPTLLADPEDGIFKLDDLDPDKESGRQLLNQTLAGKYYRKVLPAAARQYLAWVSSAD